MPEAGQWALLAALSAACAALLDFVGLPAAFFLGPMAAGVIMGVNGASIRVPRAPFTGAQAIMGVFIASAITPSILDSFFQEWPIILGVVFAIIAASSFLGWVMSRWRVMPGTTSTPRGKSCPICCRRRQDFPRIRRTSNPLILVQLIRGKFA